MRGDLTVVNCAITRGIGCKQPTHEGGNSFKKNEKTELPTPGRRRGEDAPTPQLGRGDPIAKSPWFGAVFLYKKQY